MNPIFVKAIQLLLCLSLLVVLHEGGHFGFAKLFKTRVTRFYMFANWGFHLFSTYDDWFRRLIGKPLVTKRGNEGQNFFVWLRNRWYKLTGRPERVQTENVGNKEYNPEAGTEYGIGWLPIGGYVAIAGMIDETNKKLEGEAQPWEFRSKKVWQRFLIMAGGVLMNLLTAFVIYAGIMFFVGEERMPMQNITRGFAYSQEAKELGFRDGDIPVRIDGQEIEVSPLVLIHPVGVLGQDLSNANQVTVIREGSEVNISMPQDGLNLLHLVQSYPSFMSLLSPAIVDSVVTGSAAFNAGMKAGARILAVDNTPLRYWSDYDSLLVRRQDVLSREKCTRADSLRLRQMSVVFLNAGAEFPDTVTLHLDANYMMGITRDFGIEDYQSEHIEYNLLTCIPAGCRKAWSVLEDYVDQLKYVPTKEGVESVGSFVTIGNLFPDTWDWLRFWSMTAFISVVLAVMNILPIPGLDGGHIVLLLYEAITRRKPSERVMLWLEYIGMGILLLIMIFAFGNDIRRIVLPWLFN